MANDRAPVEAAEATAPRSRLRALVLLGAAAETLFWFWTFSYIGARANPMGDGMEWLAEVPMSLIFMLLTLPALLLAWRGRYLPVAAGLVLVSAAANALLWSEIVSEFAGHVVRLRDPAGGETTPAGRYSCEG